MNIFKIAICTPESLKTHDAIVHANDLWLVPEWIEKPLEGYIQPARIIRIGHLKMNKDSLPPWIQAQVLQIIPISVLDGTGTAGYEVVEAPNIRISIPKGIH